VRCVSGVRFWERRCRIRESTEREEHWATRWHSTHVRTANAEMVRENKRVWVFHSFTQLLSTQLLCVRTAGAADQPSSRPLRHCDRGVDCGVRGTQAIAVTMTPKRRFTLPPKTAAGKRGAAATLIEAHFSVAAHARGHNLEFGAPVKRRLVQGVGTTSSGRALRKTGVPRRSYSTSSSYSSSSSSMLMAWWSPIDQRATIRMRLNPTYQSPS
jgi:hypothetical protein